MESALAGYPGDGGHGFFQGSLRGFRIFLRRRGTHLTHRVFYRVLHPWLRSRRFSFCRARFRAERCLAKVVLR